MVTVKCEKDVSVLVVGYCDTIVLEVSKTLKNHDVMTARNPETALKLCASEATRPDMIIYCIGRHPEPEDIEMLCYISSDNNVNSVPFLAIVKTDDPDKAALLVHKCGVTCFYRYPFSKELLSMEAHNMGALLYNQHSAWNRATTRYKAILKALPSAVVVVSERGNITEWTEQAEKLTDYKKKDMIGRSILTVLPPDSHREIWEIFKDCARTGRVNRREGAVVRKNGSFAPTLLSIGATGACEETIISMIDLTELQRLRAEQEKAELKTLQARIDSHLQEQHSYSIVIRLLSKEMSGTLSGDGAALKSLAQEVGGRPQINSLNASRAKKINIVGFMGSVPKVAPEAKVIDIATELWRNTKRHNKAVEDLDIQPIAAQIPEYLHPVKIAPFSLDTAVCCLVSNASRSCKEKAKALGNDYQPVVSQVAVSDGDNVKISIIDNGLGIDEYMVDAMWEPTTSSHPTDTRYVGCGLPLAQHLIKRAGGEIRLTHNTEGEGATFEITLPVWKEKKVHI